MLQGSRRLVAAVVVAAALAGGAIAHAAATQSSGASKAPARAAKGYMMAAKSKSGSCPNMGGNSKSGTTGGGNAPAV
jgi:hypothetical protein